MSDPKKVLAELLESNGYTAETRFYRATFPEFIDADGTMSANPTPSEAVIDIYGAGHTVTAESCGPGLAFTDHPHTDWDEEDRIRVEVRLGDMLDQGAMMYPVNSVIIDRVWFVTLPTGRIPTRTVD